MYLPRTLQIQLPLQPTQRPLRQIDSQGDILTGIQGQISANSVDIKSTVATKMNDDIPKTSDMTGNMSSADEQLPTATAEKPLRLHYL